MNTHKMILILIFIISLGAFRERPAFTNASATEEGFVGYVAAREEDRILVVDPNSLDFSANGGMSAYYPAKWFSNAPSGVEAGNKVEVWTDGGPENEPYPGQARAIKVYVFPPVKPEGAVLNSAEAVRKALSSSEAANIRVPAVKKVDFDPASAEWTITITQNEEQPILSIQVRDT